MGKSEGQRAPVGRRLRDARLRAGLSQKGLGVLAGIDQFSASPRINQYERGKHLPDYSTARRLASALGVSVTYLYAEDDELADLILAYGNATDKKRREIKRMLR